MAPSKTFQFLAVFLYILMFASSFQLKRTEGQQHPFKSIQSLVGIRKGQSVTDLHVVKQYLAKLGYLSYDLSINPSQNYHTDDDEFDDIFESAIRSYQQKFHLEVTGILDNGTVQQMLRPRCGVPDITKNNNNSVLIGAADYSFFFGKPKWPKTHLTYKLHPTVEVPGAENIRAICSRSFERWAQVTGFTFQEVSANSASDIVIAFYRLEHGDEEPFDGPGGIFAHSFRPTIGKLHFDADENWSSNPGPYEVDLESITVHEIGHLLGLGHSEDHPEAVMYPYFAYGEKRRNLQNDDIQGIHALYGL